MDITDINNVSIRALAMSNPNQVLSFIGALESDALVPVSAQILGPFDVGDIRTATGWTSIPDYVSGGDSSTHWGHIHFQWSTR